MKEEMDDFLKFAYEKGKVSDVSEAFEEFPVEEEWHKGRIENVLTFNEEKSQYSIYDIGDIVYVEKFRYENGAIGKNHFFVIIGQNNIAVPIENFGMLISSKLEKLKYDTNVLLEKDSKNNLKVDSIVKTDTIYRILNNQILFKIGKVDIDKVEEYKKKFYEIN